MTCFRRFPLFLLLPLFLISTEARSWGFFAHRQINRIAVFTLPPELFEFYKTHLEFITAHAVDPDKRRYASEHEAPRHYIDIDRYTPLGDPFSAIPMHYEAAAARFTEDTLLANGIVAWHIPRVTLQLSRAMQEKDTERILRLSADLGHYVADAHVPLHTTENYNGQLTGQRGIHGLWESRLPELFAEDYDYFTGLAVHIENPLLFSWQIVKESHALVDSVLKLEKQLTLSFPTDRKYSYETRGRNTVKVYSAEFSEAYHLLLNGMVERRMRASIVAVGSLWYSAWVTAGKPDLKSTLHSPLPLAITEEDALPPADQAKGRSCE